jgi:hypothetical protein
LNLGNPVNLKTLNKQGAFMTTKTTPERKHAQWPSVRYVVMNEHTLGYIENARPLMGVLAGSVLKGGHSWLNGPVSTFGCVVRDANLADFEAYRVSPPPELRNHTASF